MLPSELPAVTGYPHLKDFLSKHVDMQIQDIRSLLRLPLHRHQGGCNFVAAAGISHLIEGASVVLYEPSEEALRERKDRERRFREVICAYFPCDPLQPKNVAAAMYRYIRNPLVHALGVGESTPPMVQIAKSPRPLDEGAILALEGRARPKGVQAPVTYAADTYTFNVSGAYWGLHRLLHELLGDDEQATKSDAFARDVLGC